MVKKMKVRCPKYGEEFEVSLPKIEVPKEQVLIYELPIQTSPETARLWEKRKNQLKH